MKKVIIFLFSIFPLFASCQNKWQTVNYNGVSVQIPSDWGSKNTENHYEETDITEYQISCWAKDKSTLSLAIQWVDTEIEANTYIKLLIEMQQERFPMFKEFDYDKIVDATFNGLAAKKCHFSKYIDNISFEGEYIAFTKNQYSYIVLISGNKDFYKSIDYNKILISITPNFSGTALQNKSNVSTTETTDNFTRYEFKQYALSVPNTMELRNENSFMSLGKEILRDKLKSIKKIDVGDFNFVFQPAGNDNVTNLDRQKKALDLYARVLISYDKSNLGDYASWNDDITYSQSEYNELNKTFKDNLLSQAAHMKKMGIENPFINIEIINIENIKVGKNANKFVYIKQQYTRKGFNGNVKVTDFYIHNNNEMVKLTISYRVSEINLWEADFSKIIDTFSFTTKK
jgi:hypothetical protein